MTSSCLVGGIGSFQFLFGSKDLVDGASWNFNTICNNPWPHQPLSLHLVLSSSGEQSAKTRFPRFCTAIAQHFTVPVPKSWPLPPSKSLTNQFTQDLMQLSQHCCYRQRCSNCPPPEFSCGRKRSSTHSFLQMLDLTPILLLSELSQYVA